MKTNTHPFKVNLHGFMLMLSAISSSGFTRRNGINQSLGEGGLLCRRINEHTVDRLIKLSFFILAAAFLFCGTAALAVGQSPDAGLNTSVANLTSILNNSLVPVVLICGCLAGAAISFMKSSPTPFIIALITTASFGFAKAWIGGTYAVCV